MEVVPKADHLAGRAGRQHLHAAERQALPGRPRTLEHVALVDRDGLAVQRAEADLSLMLKPHPARHEPYSPVFSFVFRTMASSSGTRHGPRRIPVPARHRSHRNRMPGSNHKSRGKPKVAAQHVRMQPARAAQIDPTLAKPPGSDNREACDQGALLLTSSLSDLRSVLACWPDPDDFFQTRDQACLEGGFWPARGVRPGSGPLPVMRAACGPNQRGQVLS